MLEQTTTKVTDKVLQSLSELWPHRTFSVIYIDTTLRVGYDANVTPREARSITKHVDFLLAREYSVRSYTVTQMPF